MGRNLDLGGIHQSNAARTGREIKMHEASSHVVVTLCMLHPRAPASNTQPTKLRAVLDTIACGLNLVKLSALDFRLFKQLFQDMDPSHEKLLFYAGICCLSKGKVLKGVLSCKEEMFPFQMSFRKWRL